VSNQIPQHQIDLIIQNLPKKLINELINFISEELEKSSQIEYIFCWLKPLINFHSDVLGGQDLGTISNIKNALKSLKRRVDVINGM
jgi:hypothetical protein